MRAGYRRDERSELLVATQRIQARLDPYVREPCRSLLVCAVEPVEGLIALAERSVNDGDLIGSDLSSL